MNEDLRRELEKEKRLLEMLRADKLMSRVWAPVQREFANSLTREKLISGGNQLGKTDIVLALTAMHLEGRYPRWYKGHRFNHPVRWAVAGPTLEATFDNIVERLFGTDWDGSGWLSPDSFENPNKARPRSVPVKHSSGGTSILRIFSYDQGARRIQGRTVEGVTVDESPKLEVVEELSQRLNATRGWLIGAVSPKEDDAVEVIDLFEETPGGFRKVFYYGIDDATWMTDEQRREIKLKNQHNPLAEATLYGRPVARLGLVYRTPQSLYTYEAKPLVGGKSIIGIDLPHSSGTFAAVRLTQVDDKWHVEREWKCAGLTIEDYAKAVKEQLGGSTTPVAWPHDGGRILGDGVSAAESYRRLGLNMLPLPAYMVGIDGKKHRSIVAVVEELSLALANGQLVVSDDCPALLKELTRYRWVKGSPGKKPQRADDHLHDALCKSWMMRHYGEGGTQAPPLSPHTSSIARYVGRGYNPLGGARTPRWQTPWRR